MLHPQKHLKRKEYHTSAAFAADVELVFANAFQFNQEESQVYQDAVSLKVSTELSKPALSLKCVHRATFAN